VVDRSLAREERSRRRAILYARVSTRGQVRSGYSLAQQREALTEYAAHIGYEVLEEVTDLGESGASLERPGMDRVRELVASGSVSVVLTQDLDRLAREPEHYRLLLHEFAEKGCGLEFLSPLGFSEDRLPKYERAKIAERTQRGKLRKAREGKIAGGTKPNYGFRFNATREGYEVDEGTMRVVRRIFHMVGVEQRALNAVKRTLETEKVPTPSGNNLWATWVIRGFILDDVYKPHANGEVAKLVTPEVAMRLDPDKPYGIWWFNRERWTSKRVSEVSGGDRVYRRSVRAVSKPKEEWVAVPVPDSRVPREVVDKAREAVLKNRWNVTRGDRFWELSGGILRCACCGWRMRTCVTRKRERKYFYYACAKRREGREACPNRSSYRAESLEPAVWQTVCAMFVDGDMVRDGFDATIRQVRKGERGNPDAETARWLQTLAEADRMRNSYQEMTAKGLMTFDELGTRLEEVENTRRLVLRELEKIKDRREDVARLERDMDDLLRTYVGSPPDRLEGLGAEERHLIYRKLRLEVLLGADGTLAVSGIPGRHDGLQEGQTGSSP